MDCEGRSLFNLLLILRPDEVESVAHRVFLNKNIFAICKVSRPFTDSKRGKAMKLKSELFSTIALAITALIAGNAIAAPIPSISVQTACYQHGAGYQYLYSFEAEDSTIAICKKGSQHYYLKLPKLVPDIKETTPSLNPTPTKPSRIYQA